MRRLLGFILLICAAVLLAACRPAGIQTTKNLRIEFAADGLRLSARHIPAGDKITLTVVNSTPFEHILILHADSSSQAQTPIPANRILFQVVILPNQTVETVFTAPRAPGNYSWSCTQPAHWDQGENSRVTVVHPDYAR